MRLVHILAALMIGSVLTVSAVFAADNYKIDPVHGTIIYRISHFNIGQAYGRFNNPTGKVVLDKDDAGKSSFEFTVKANDIDTANAKRDSDLKGPDFFDAKQFPTIMFKSTGVKSAGDNKYDVTGDLTLHGVTKSITVPISKTGEGDTKMMGYRTGWLAEYDLKRSEYGIMGLQGPVGDDVHLIISFEAVKQ